jgi:pyrroloquinoline-quinone synthase
MSDFWARLDEVRAENDVLQHPFYVRWTNGELSREELATYAGEYRHAVVAIADVAELAADDGDERLHRHAMEERSHIELWDRFADAVGAGTGELAPETAACVDAWTHGEDSLDRLVALYALEAAQPAIAEVKRDGLVRFYGVEPGPGTSYFDVHAELDREHAAEGRELIAERLAGADEERLIGHAQEALEGYWTLLDGVDKLSASG